jgi:hypothetical protein
MTRKQTMILAAALFCPLAFCIPDVFAGRSDVGTSGAVFLKLNAGSRPAAMGEAFGGIANDVNALYYNPAGAGFLAKPEFTAQYGSWFQSISYNALGFIYPVQGFGSLGLGVVNLGVTDIEKRSSDSVDPEGTFGASDYAYFLHYSRAVTSRLAAGVNLKLVSQKIDDRSATAYCGDAGVLWQTPVNNLSAGLAVQNLGNEVKFDVTGDPLPLNIKAGLGYALALRSRSRLLVGLDANMPRDNDVMVFGGAEYSRAFGGEFAAALRAGYKNVAQEKLGGMAGLTAGAGLTWRQFSLDFAWVPYGDLGDTFRYSLVAKF